MSAWKAVQAVVAMLEGIPAAIVPAGHVGVLRPSASTDLPRVVVSVTEAQDLSNGIGAVVSSSRQADGSWRTASETTTSGVLDLELWAAAEPSMSQLTDSVFDLLAGPPKTLAEVGFARLTTRSAGPVETVPLPAGGTGLRLAAACPFLFEEPTVEETKNAGIIKQVQVTLEGELAEAFGLT